MELLFILGPSILVLALINYLFPNVLKTKAANSFFDYLFFGGLIATGLILLGIINGSVEAKYLIVSMIVTFSIFAKIMFFD